MHIKDLFFELIQVAIGLRETLPVTPTKEQWAELFVMSKKQALVAVTFKGVSKILGAAPKGDHKLGAIDEMIYLQWLGLTAKCAQRNREMNAICAKVCNDFAQDGVVSVVLKGQSNLEYYPEELRDCRTAGDIDLWCDVPVGVEVSHEVLDKVEKREYRGMEGVIEYCKQYERCQGREIPWHRVLYYHCELTSPSGIGIEPHYRPSYLCSPIRNWRLQRWFRENEQFGVCDFAVGGDKTKTIKNPEEAASACASENSSDGSTSSPQRLGSSATQSSTAIDNGDYTSSGKKQEKQPSGSFPIPTVSFNAVYQLLHIYKHLFEEGIGLRQLLDYYFVLRALHIEQGSFSDRTEPMAQWAVLRHLRQAQVPGEGSVGELAEPQEPEKDTVGERSRIQRIAVKSNAEIMHTLGRFGMKKFAGATMWVLAQVFDSETKTIKTPEEAASACISENSSDGSTSSPQRLGSSATQSSTAIDNGNSTSSGKKQEKQFDWKQRHPWMICEPNEKEGKFLLNEIMMAGNFGKYDTRISHSSSQMGHAWEKLKHNFRLIRHYPEEVLWEPVFRVYHWLWRRFELWRY